MRFLAKKSWYIDDFGTFGRSHADRTNSFSHHPNTFRQTLIIDVDNVSIFHKFCMIIIRTGSFHKARNKVKIFQITWQWRIQSEFWCNTVIYILGKKLKTGG